MSSFQPVTHLPIDESYRQIVASIDRESLIYNLRYEKRPEGMVLLHQRAAKLRVRPISMNPAVNRVLLEYAGIKGLIQGELRKLSDDELREAALKEGRPRVNHWIHEELKSRRGQQNTLSQYFQSNAQDDDAEDLAIQEWVKNLRVGS